MEPKNVCGDQIRCLIFVSNCTDFGQGIGVCGWCHEADSTEPRQRTLALTTHHPWLFFSHKTLQGGKPRANFIFARGVHIPRR